MLKKDNPAPFDGYLFTLSEGKAIAEGWSKSAADAESYKNAYEQVKREAQESLDELNNINERTSKRLKRIRKESLAKARWNSFIWFIFGGAVGAVIHNNR